jgi:hypothetical protein
MAGREEKRRRKRVLWAKSKGICVICHLHVGLDECVFLKGEEVDDENAVVHKRCKGMAGAAVADDSGDDE